MSTGSANTGRPCSPATDLNFPIVDYHVHFGPGFDIDQVVELSRKRGMKFGIVEHPINDMADDEGLQRYIKRLRQYPVYVGLQPMTLRWAERFSPEVLSKLDYVLMDADTIPQPDGTYLRIYQNDLFIPDMEQFMELYLNHIRQILENEPINIFARPTYLPINFARFYDKLWTKERMQMIIDLALARNIALEIQENICLPSNTFIEMAKQAGIKFTFGTNARNVNAGNFNYCIAMARKHGLTRKNMLILD